VLHLRAMVLVSCAAMPAMAAAQELAARPRTSIESTAQRLRPAAAAANSPLPLASPSSEAGSGKAGAAGRWNPGSAGPSLATMLASLAIVLGLFLLVTWMLRKSMPAGGRALPSDVIEVLGRVLLAPRQPAQLIRLGHKLILVSISAAGVKTLTEITDPAEVDRLAGLCRAAHPQSSTATFRQVFQQFGRQPASGFLDDEASHAAAARGVEAEEALS
jgi:flagellar biogenesis protein FliO